MICPSLFLKEKDTSQNIVHKPTKKIMTDQRYNQRGVSASKEDVHNAIKDIDKGLYPNAFCKIVPDKI